MNDQEAKKFPLLKEYDFVLASAGKSGHGILLVPNNKAIYIAKQYGLGELALVPFLQESFNNNEEILVQDLEERLEIESMSLCRGFEEPFYKSVLKKLQLHDIVNIVKNAGSEKIISQEDKIAPGENYLTARVYFIAGREATRESLYSIW